MRFLMVLSFLLCLMVIMGIESAGAEPRLMKTIPDDVTNTKNVDKLRSSALLPGMRFKVTRSSGLEGTEIYPNGHRIPFRLFQQFIFDQEIIAASHGFIREATRKIHSAKLYSLHHPSCQIIQQEIVPQGTLFHIYHKSIGSTLFNETSDKQIHDEYLISVFARPLIPRLWPLTTLHIGQKWSYQDKDLVKRIGLIEILGGHIDLEVKKLQPDPRSSKPTACIRGRLKSKLDLDGIIFNFDADVAIDLQTSKDVPFIISFDGTLSGSGSYVDERGKVIPSQIKAQGTVFQIAKQLPTHDNLK